MKTFVPAGLVFITTLTLAAAASEQTANPPGPGPGHEVAVQAAWASTPAAVRPFHLPDVPYQYSVLNLPVHFTQPAALRFDNTPADNPTTDEGATLGRVLFYDKRLSVNNTISCGSCHVQKFGFVDPHRFSTGFDGRQTDRHAMNLVNLRYDPRGRFFWDERGGNLEAMVLMPVENHLEMGQDLAKLPTILGRDARYRDLFRQAFGDESITPGSISRALAQFVRSMVSYQAKYDVGRASAGSAAQDFANYTVQENRGKALFLRNCSICHLPDQEAHFVMVAPANTGLDEDPQTSDGGVGDITLNPREVGQFKSPTLRNVEVTAPYMHDGRFATLDAVIEHYSSGGKKHPNKDVRVQAMNFTVSEQAAIIAFLKTLTDWTFLKDPKFSDPWE